MSELHAVSAHVKLGIGLLALGMYGVWPGARYMLTQAALMVTGGALFGISLLRPLFSNWKAHSQDLRNLQGGTYSGQSNSLPITKQIHAD